MKVGFLDKLIDRLDRLDPESIQTHFLHLVQEKGLLETIFQSIQEGVVVIDADGRLSYANKAAEQMLGFSLSSTRGRPVSNYIREIDWDRILRLDENEWSKLISREIEITYPEHRFVNFYVVPLLPKTGRKEGAVVILRDITHDREHEASMLASERFNAIKLLAAGVAHEIGNPLNALNIHLQLLEREVHAITGDQSKDLGDLVEVARDEVARLDMIISQFLRAIRPAKLKLVQSNMASLVEETLVLLKQEIQDREITVEIDYTKSLPRIRVDRDQIKQVLFNVIRNSFQAMSDGGLLRISLSGTDKFLVVSIQDTGVGIKREDFGHIFEPYHTSKPDGSGLGLMIVHRIVQDHGGQIEVSSKRGKGTSFTILLPLAERRMRLLKARAAGTREIEE